MKKKVICFISILIMATLTACVNSAEALDDAVQSEWIEVEAVAIEQKAETANTEMTSEEVLDLFMNGSISAMDTTDMTTTFHITDFKMNSEEWDSCSVGERMDLDNDGEEEQIICGPYGGIYLDARENKVYDLATGDGNANVLSYTYYNGEIWIMYSNCVTPGYEYYHMKKYEGADNLVAEIRFSAEPMDEENPQAGVKYVLNGKEISYEEYAAFCSKVFAAEESTTVTDV